MRRILITAAAALAVTAGLARPVAASPPETATGTLSIATDTFTTIRIAGGNSFFAEVATGAYSGDLTGPYIDIDTFVLHKDGSFDAHGTEVCTACTIGGRTGSFTSAFEYSGSGAQFEGHLTFTGGTGELAGLRGEGTFQGDGIDNTYSYRYDFAP
jgi:hypothetical protein